MVEPVLMSEVNAVVRVTVPDTVFTDELLYPTIADDVAPKELVPVTIMPGAMLFVE